MSMPISKPLLALLLAAAVASVLVLLKPETDKPTAADDSLLMERPGTGKPASTVAADRIPWQRAPVEAPSTATLTQGFAPPPPPPSVMPVVVTPPPPKPVAPTPSFVYLGRMVRDDTIYVFLGQGENVEVVPLGADVDGGWRVEKITDAGLELRYLPLNETRQLAMSDK